MPADRLDVLLIEDNPGDARLIEEMLRDAEELLRRVEAGAETAAVPEVHHEQRLSAGLERLSATDVDVVLLDLGLPDSTGLDTLARVVEATEFVPIVVLTGLREEGVGIEAIQRGAQDYLVKDEVTGDLLVRSIHHAIERNRQERERARHLEQLEALNRLNRIGQDVTHAVITTSTREELERAVCERLAESNAYRLAWIGEVDQGTDRLTPRAAAGAGADHVEELAVAIADDDPGPIGRAARTREVQVVQDVRADPAIEPPGESDPEYRSSASVPIVYEDVVYGVLTVYAASPSAFSEPEAEILSRLGDVIGHAITAIERKDALVSDVVLELEFRVEGVAEELVDLSADGQSTIVLENLLHDDALIAYGRADGVPWEEFRDAAERTEVVDDLRLLTPDRDEYEFELTTGTVGALADAVATHGGHVAAVTIADGEFRFVVEFPPGRDRRQLVGLVEEHCPGATNLAQRVVERDDRDVSDARSVLRNQLTEKQRTALETAYFAGFFDWPRRSSGQELADRLGVVPATFSEHLRAAERKFFDAVFQGEGADDRTAPSARTSPEPDSEGPR